MTNPYFESELKLERTERSLPDEDPIKTQENLYYKELNQYKHEVNDGLQVEEEGLEQYQKLKEMNTIKMKKSKLNKQMNELNGTNENSQKMSILNDEEQIRNIKNLYYNILKPSRILESIGNIVGHNKEVVKDNEKVKHVNSVEKETREVQDQTRIINVKISDEMHAATSNEIVLSENVKYQIDNSSLANDKARVISKAGSDEINTKRKVHNNHSIDNERTTTESTDDADPAIKITDAFLTHIRHGRKHKHLYNDTDTVPNSNYLYNSDFHNRKISPKFDQKFENFRKEFTDEKSPNKGAVNKTQTMAEFPDRSILSNELIHNKTSVDNKIIVPALTSMNPRTKRKVSYEVISEDSGNTM